MSESGKESGSLVFERNINMEMGDTVFTPHMLKILAQVNGRNTLRDIAVKSGLTNADFKNAFNLLYQKRLIVQVDQAKQGPVLQRSFFVTMNTMMAESLGPISSKVLSKTITEMGERPDNFPASRGYELVKLIAGKIGSGGDKTAFIKEMASLLNETR